jgi:LPXTG-motif cell wall-anchored protein
MKTKNYLFILLTCLILTTSLNLAQEKLCNPKVEILNQNPYPAIPGEKLEIVFTISNIDSNDCGEIEFEILDEFPFSVAKTSKSLHIIQTGTFTKNYNSFKTIPIDFTVDSDAMDGNNPLEVRYKSSRSSGGSVLERFNIEIKDIRADFEIFVSSYNPATKEITFEILNIGKEDIEALTVEVKKQEDVKIYETNKKNIGDLSSKEDTSATFKLDIDTDQIELIISYSDITKKRREITKKVAFDSSLFGNDINSKGNNYFYWIILTIVIIVALYFFLKKKKRK